ncbi:MAG: xanthine dehydrogenase family protein subunit M [Burkholderiaceae bacterium]
MKPAPFDYQRAASLDEALRLIGGAADARVIAGGQSLVPMLHLRLARPALLVDLSALPALRAATEHGDRVEYGALVTHAAVEDGRAPDPCGGYLQHVAAGIAYRPVRNRGTVAGSLAHADPAADWPTALSAAGASVVLTGSGGQRRLELAEFLQAPFTTALQDGEIVTAVSVPRRSPASRWSYVKHARKAGEFALSLAAIVLDRDAGFARIAVGGLAGRPQLLPELAGRLLDDSTQMLRGFDLPAAERALAAAAPSNDPVRLRLHAATLCRAVRGLQ